MRLFKSRKLLIVGLGNPGPEYSMTRHNAGFMAVDYLAGEGAKWKKEKNYLFYKIASQQSGLFSTKYLKDILSFPRRREQGLLSKRPHNITESSAQNDANYKEIIFIKPLTYMNLSGAAVLAAMQKYRIRLENLTVIHDELDLPLGETRTKTGGGNAGHNGLKSISAAVGNDYRRIRIGIGRPENPKIDVSAWVLGRFTADEAAAIHTAIESIGDQ